MSSLVPELDSCPIQMVDAHMGMNCNGEALTKTQTRTGPHFQSGLVKKGSQTFYLALKWSKTQVPSSPIRGTQGSEGHPSNGSTF